MLRSTLIFSEISSPLRIKQQSRWKQNLWQQQPRLSRVATHFLRKGKCLLHRTLLGSKSGAIPSRKFQAWSLKSHTPAPESGQGTHHSGYQQLHQQYLP